MTRHARSVIDFPQEIDDSFSMLIEIFHNMSQSEREMCIRNLKERQERAKKIVDEYEPLIPYLIKLLEELKGNE